MEDKIKLYPAGCPVCGGQFIVITEEQEVETGREWSGHCRACQCSMAGAEITKPTSH